MTSEQIKAKMAELQAQLDKTELQTALDTIANLKKQHAEALAESQRQLSVHQERLAKAMEREASLKTDLQKAVEANKQLAGQAKQLSETIARYDMHPEVKAAKRKAMEEQAAKLLKAAESLKEPEPKPE